MRIGVEAREAFDLPERRSRSRSAGPRSTPEPIAGLDGHVRFCADGRLTSLGAQAVAGPDPWRSTLRRAYAARSSVASLSGSFDGSAASAATRTDDVTHPDTGAGK